MSQTVDEGEKLDNSSIIADAHVSWQDTLLRCKRGLYINVHFVIKVQKEK